MLALMSSSSFCVYCTLARSSANSFAVLLTMLSKRLFVSSTNDWRHAWNVDCCICSSFSNTSSLLANAAFTMVSTFVSCSSSTCETDRVGFPIVTVSASIQLWITCQFTVRVSQTIVIPVHTCVVTRLLPVDSRKD